LLGAVDEVAAPTSRADAAVPTQEADADALPDAPRRHCIADRVDPPDDLVPRDPGIGDAGELPLDGGGVAVADAACLDANAYLGRSRCRNGLLDELESSGCNHLNCSERVHAYLQYDRSS
jgi:hypothetical protein